MAMMGVMSVYHPDIIRFLLAKQEENKMTTTNLSVMVDNLFMEKVINGEKYWTEFEGIKYQEYDAKTIFDLLVEGAWKNGEPGILFYDKINDSPYKYSNQKIWATNPCGEQPLPANGACNLGNFDITKFLNNKILDFNLLEKAVKLSVRFLDNVIEKSYYPTEQIKKWVEENRPIGIGIMGLADYFLIKEIAYGSPESIEELKNIIMFIKNVAEKESISLGKELGIPKSCQVLPSPRRNITLISIAPTGTVSLLAGCSSSIEPIFSELILRNDKTGSYSFENNLSDKPYFRCAVSTNGSQEVTWEEHVKIQAMAQEYCDSGVSKTINFPNHTRRETFAKAIILAWESGCKGLAMYRDKSRKVQVLTPQSIKENKCPLCGNEMVEINGKLRCVTCIKIEKIDEVSPYN